MLVFDVKNNELVVWYCQNHKVSSVQRFGSNLGHPSSPLPPIR